jgi:hypothetical protein
MSSISESQSHSASPNIVFIVPYRNRIQHKYFFSMYLTSILKDVVDPYEIYFAHQCDTRSFNRGGTKNIGFQAVKSKYPESYKDMTFVFNDIDTIPFSNIFDYKTTHGIVKHFYGFNYALGGIVSITGADFEATNGFPSFWGWGMEDAVLQTRCEKIGLQIDRSHFYPIGSPNILQLFDGVSRLINRKDPLRAKHDNGHDGLRAIHKLEYTIDKESSNPQDNIHIINSEQIFIVNINTFMTATQYEPTGFYEYDLREPPQKIMNPGAGRENTNKQYATSDSWTNIPFYPTAEKRRELVRQYGQSKADEIIEYSYNNSTDPTKAIIPPPPPPKQPPNTNKMTNPSNLLEQQLQLIQIQQYNEKMRQQNSNARIIPPNINKFSPAYARIIASKPKASKSANVRLGGIY